jgi:hypothetical protein
MPSLRLFHLRRQIATSLAPALLATSLAAATAPVAGQPLPPWEKGLLDIHQINNGTGDAAFLVLPDGTTMILDAGAGFRPDQVKSRYDAPQRPNASLRPGQWVTKYIQRVHPQGARGEVDYAMLTHFHGDHMGTLVPSSPKSAVGPYRLTGITDVGDAIHFRKVIDRGWPTYNYPGQSGGEMMLNYRAFLEWQIKNRGLKVERFEAGRADQIVLVHAPKDFPQFSVQNIAANGYVWTGGGTATRNRFPEGLLPDENNCSLAFRMNYGAFSYFNGGDMAGVPDAPVAGVPPKNAVTWAEMESAVAWVTGPVDVHALNHHGTPDAVNAFFLSVLSPRVSIASIYASSQPGPEVLRRLLSERVYPGARDVFLTNFLWEGRREHMVKLYGEKDTAWLIDEIGKLPSHQGHVLVRVDAGGGSYRVIVIDDSKEDGAVKSVHGPYPSRGQPAARR